MEVPLEVLVRRPRLEPHLGVHRVGDVDGVGERAMGLDRGVGVLPRLDVHDDVLQALLGQHPEAEMDGLGDTGTRFDTDVDLDAVVELLGIDLQARHQVGADDLVAVDLEMGHIVAADVGAEGAEAGEQFARRLDLLLRRTHRCAPWPKTARLTARLTRTPPGAPPRRARWYAHRACNGRRNSRRYGPPDPCRGWCRCT